MKRDENLHPLSRHHHAGLVQAHRLMYVGTERAKMPLEEVLQTTVSFWEEGGQEHFREEEEVLLPVAALHVDLTGEAMIVDMLMEHVQIRSDMVKISQMAEGSKQPDIAFLQNAGMLLEAHIRKEERIIFPWLEERLPDSALQRLGTIFHEAEQAREQRTH